MSLVLRKGVWHVRKIINGVKLNRSTKTGNRRVAEQMEAKWTAEVVDEVVLRGKVPIDLHRAIDEFVSSRSHLASADNCRTRMAWFKSAIHDKALHRVSDREIIEVVEKRLADGYAKGTVNGAIIYWNSFIKHADSKGYSVCGKLKGLGASKGKLRWLTAEEEALLLAQLDPTTMYKGKNAERDEASWSLYGVFVRLYKSTTYRANSGEITSANRYL